MLEKLPHNIPAEFVLKHVLETEIGTLFFYGNIVVMEAREGVVLSHKNGFSILLKALKLLGTQKWVYISNRINSYSVKPIDYKYLNKIPTLKAVAIVNYFEVGYLNAELESKFCKKPFQVFHNLNNAFMWSQGFL